MYCTKCGKQIADSAKFCTFCGAPIKNKQDDNNVQHQAQIVESQQNPQKSKLGLILGIVFGVLFLCVAGIGVSLFVTGYAQEQIGIFIGKFSGNKEDDIRGSGSASKTDEEDDTDDGRSDSGETSEGYEEEETTSYDSLKQNAADRTQVHVSLVSTDVSDFPLVRLYLDVTDDYGEQIDLLTPVGAVKEAVNGGEFVEREVKRIEKLEGNEGLSIELIADKSGSMDWRMEQVKGVMSQFVNSLDYASGDQVELIAFDTYVMYMCTKTNNVSLLNNGIYNMVPTGSTALYDALYEGVINAGLQPGARCVIAFTDGDDNESIHTYQEIINLAVQSSVSIYIIGTDKYAEGTLQNIAFSTNGYYWYIDDLADMGMIFDEIYEEQKDLYCLEYESDDFTGQYSDRTVDFIIGDASVVADFTGSFTPVETLKVQEHTSRYEIVAADLSWTDANTECIFKGGHLATITSEDEMNQLIEMAEASGLKYLWIGGYTSVSGSQAFGHWVTGEPFNYTAWYEGEPSRNDMDGTPEMYIMMWKLKNEWSWNDQRNDPAGELSYFLGNMGYICEYEE